MNGTPIVSILPDKPTTADVVDLLTAHLTFVNAQSAPEDVHALDVEALMAPEISFFAARIDDRLFGVGAIKQLTDDHYEIKSMHTAEAARGQGVGRLMVEHLLAFARDRGAVRVSLETGTMQAMAPARALYTRLGFVECAPFAGYWATEASVCMTLALDEVS